MQRTAGNAQYWLDWVDAGNRPHEYGKDNTVAFVAHYKRQLAETTAYLRANR